MKISKFYKNIRERRIDVNIIIALKACITIEYYFLYGPYDVVKPYKNIDLPRIVLKYIHESWYNQSNSNKGVQVSFIEIIERSK